MIESLSQLICDLLNPGPNNSMQDLLKKGINFLNLFVSNYKLNVADFMIDYSYVCTKSF